MLAPCVICLEVKDDDVFVILTNMRPCAVMLTGRHAGREREQIRRAAERLRERLQKQHKERRDGTRVL